MKTTQTEHTIAIERATPDDMPAVYQLLERSNLPVEGLAEHVSHTLVARDGARPEGAVGSAALEVYGQYALLRSVAVDEGLRGRGVGQRLTEVALELARQEGVTRVYLLTETAGEFFPRFGFAPVRREEVPAPVLESVEFTTLCPASSLVMGLDLGRA
jgi:amino-acid N-acetyltransferase